MKDVTGCDKPGAGVKHPLIPGFPNGFNPAGLGNQIPSSMAECIGQLKSTQGTETSKYLQERKSIETPLVAASESGIAQTRELALWGCGRRHKSRNG